MGGFQGGLFESFTYFLCLVLFSCGNLVFEIYAISGLVWRWFRSCSRIYESSGAGFGLLMSPTVDRYDMSEGRNKLYRPANA